MITIDSSDKAIANGHQECRKCTIDLCKDFHRDKHQRFSWVNAIIKGDNFYISPPCTYGISENKFKLVIHHTKSSFEVKDYNFSTLEDCIEYMILHKDLQLEDYLRLLRIKNEMG